MNDIDDAYDQLMTAEGWEGVRCAAFAIIRHIKAADQPEREAKGGLGDDDGTAAADRLLAEWDADRPYSSPEARRVSLRNRIASALRTAANRPDGGDAIGCFDCGRQYGDEHGFPDLVIPNDAWQKISPKGNEGGLLCPSCICKRLHDAGLNVRGAFRSGPLCEPDPPDAGQDDEAGAREMYVYCIANHPFQVEDGHPSWADVCEYPRERDFWIAAYRFAKERGASGEYERGRRDSNAVFRAKLAEAEARHAEIRAALCKLADVEIDTGEVTLEIVRLVELDVNCEWERANAAEEALGRMRDAKRMAEERAEKAEAKVAAWGERIRAAKSRAENAEDLLVQIRAALEIGDGDELLQIRKVKEYVSKVQDENSQLCSYEEAYRLAETKLAAWLPVMLAVCAECSREERTIDNADALSAATEAAVDALPAEMRPEQEKS